MPSRRPVIGIPVDVKSIDGESFHAVGEKYIAAVAHGAGATPLLIPALGAGADMASLEYAIRPEALLQRLDALFVPGSPSNVEPALYGSKEPRRGGGDSQRDSTTLALIRAALAADMPLLAVCRGLQELNVALGGTLDQAVHERPDRMDHREDKSLPRERRYEAAHDVELVENGALARVVGERRIRVNSLHEQGIHQLASPLAAEATAPDGLIEAASVPGKTFAIAVQWHPEWRFRENPASAALFAAFGRAAAARAGLDARAAG
ncbi:MAG: gamma-glutamyl-gamma-aminobutyrate hydrolase family protein [Ectothiorhodospiraceae bacterium]|jgi:putative glutamine amidotransferase